MQTLSALEGAVHHPLFRFLDATQGAMQCELLVHPLQGWAIATEQPGKGRPNLMPCAPTLAAKICREFNVPFDSLVLLTRCVYGPGNESIYVQRFGHGEVDLFETARFLAPTREPLMEHQVSALLEGLQAGQGVSPQWRTLARAVGVKNG
jgi:hypothetical protein